MVSRKRNKGRDRKAKRAETERAETRKIWQGWALGRAGNNATKITDCNHGLVMTISDDISHPISEFMDTYAANASRKSLTVLDNLIDTFVKYIEVWRDDSYRKMVIDILTSIGVHFILADGSGNDDDTYYTTFAILILENYDRTGDMITAYNKHSVQLKLRDFAAGGSSRTRGLLKFFSKRISCSCLKEMHSEARETMPKLGKCDHCLEVMHRRLLMVCSRCRAAHYCSRECHIADWPEHQGCCDQCIKTSE